MQSRFFSKLLLGLVVTLVIALAVSIFTVTTASTKFFYTYTDLGIPKGSTASLATEINESGQVVGYVANNTDGPFHAFFWEKGMMTELGTLGGRISRTYRGINNKGQVVGLAETKDVDYNKHPVYHAFLWSKQLGMIDLTANERMFRTRATDINDAGQVLIATENNTLLLWEKGKTTNICVNKTGYCYGYDLNNKSEVVGFIDVDQGKYWVHHAHIWKKGKIIDLGTLGIEENSSEATAINNQGTVVGFSSTKDWSLHAFQWKKGRMTDLGNLGGRITTAMDINDQGKVVGYSNLSNGTMHAFVWQDGKMTDLNSMLEPQCRCELEMATGINNKGQIVGWAKCNSPEERAFLLTPTWVTQ